MLPAAFIPDENILEVQMNNISDKVAVIIPAYEPDEKLVTLVKELTQNGLYNIVVVDDGSGEACSDIFARVSCVEGCEVFTHAVNLGKGRSLKDAFNHCLSRWPGLVGAVTADSDGQHSPEDIRRCMEALAEDPGSLVLGVRKFDGKDVPFKSRAGNRITSVVFRLLMGLKISDTQTGLRGIGASFMKKLCSVSGERYEFETNMLIETKTRNIPIREVPIRTIYIDENKSSHFRPFWDSVRIYALILKYTASSGISSVVDLALFTLFCSLFRDSSAGFNYILLSTALARVISAVLNYFINLKMVFATGVSVRRSIWKYALLAVIQLCASGLLVRLIYPHIGGLETFVKLPVDVMLFFVNYWIQREYIYRDDKDDG